MILTETWFRINSTEDIKGYNEYHKLRNENRSGGVSVYVRQNLGYEFMDDMCVVNDTIEHCTVKVDLVGSNIYIHVLGTYRPHAETTTIFTETIVNISSHIRLRNIQCVVIGDLNLNSLGNSSETVDFKSTMFSFPYLPLISKPKIFSSNAAYELLV